MLKLKRSIDLTWQSTPKWTVIHFGVSAVQAILPLSLIYVIKLIVDRIAVNLNVVNKDFNAVLGLLIIASLIMFAINLAAVLAELVSTTLSQKVTDHMQAALYRKATTIDLEIYEDPKHLDILERAKWEAPYRPTKMLHDLTAAGKSSISLLAIVGLILSLHWGIICLLLVATAPMVFLRLRQSKVLYTWHRQHTELERKANYLGHLLLGEQPAKEIRLFNIGDLLIERFHHLRDQLFHEQLAITFRQAITRLVSQGFAGIAVFITYGFFIHETLQGRLQLGDLVLYTQVFQRGQADLSSLVGSLGRLNENNLFLTDVFDFLAIEPKLKSGPKTIPRPLQTGITFQNVSFRYQNASRHALKQINLTIAPREIIALVGENGCGKTTLVKLLCRLYDATDGAVTLDGHNIKDFSVQDIQSQLSVIFQDYTRYQFTAEDNIWLGNAALGKNTDRIIQAAHQSGADAVIAKLPQGYDTLLGKWFKGGEELSGGEWQKIALARAFLRDAQLVILDEPTSAMDARAEAEVFQKFRDLMRDRSALLITHRLSTVKMADRIYVMHQGEIVEQGSHDELLAKNGRYNALYSTQARTYQ
jgi:ATP-binding cassette, subfamily B, bacterial